MLKTKIIASFKDAAKKLTGHKRRAFQAKISNDYLGGSVRKAEKIFGWGRGTVELGLHEMRSGIICLGNYSARGRCRSEEDDEQLKNDIHNLVENQTQTDPKFQTAKRFCKISARSVCRMLEEEKDYEKGGFSIRTMSNILNRMGYTLKKL